MVVTVAFLVDSFVSVDPLSVKDPLASLLTLFEGKTLWVSSAIMKVDWSSFPSKPIRSRGVRCALRGNAMADDRQIRLKKA